MNILTHDYDYCLTKCPRYVCDVFPSCYKQSKYSQAMLICFSVFNFSLCVVEVVMFCLFVANRKRAPQFPQHLKIFPAAVVALLTRGMWYLLSQYYYDGDMIVASEQALSVIAITSVYLCQSFYVQTWLRVIVLLSHLKGEKVIRISFITTDCIIGIASLTCAVLRIVHGNDKDSHMYDDIITFLCFIIAIGAVVYIVVGGGIFIKLRSFYNLCSKSVMSFLAISFAFVAVAVMRLIFFYWRSLTGEYLD